MALPLFLAVAGKAITAFETSKSLKWEADMFGHEAQFAQDKLDLDEDLLADRARRAIGTARAIAGASGFATDEGTNLDVISDIRRNVAINAAIIRTNGKMAKWSALKSQKAKEREASGVIKKAVFDIGGSFIK